MGHASDFYCFFQALEDHDKENFMHQELWVSEKYKVSVDTLTNKHLETHGCIINTVATDALLIKHQAISIHSADLVFIVLWPKIHKKI